MNVHGILSVGLLALFAAAITPAHADVITFDTAPLSSSSGFTGSVVEGLYLYSVSSGTLDVAAHGNPGQDMQGFYPASNGSQNGVLTITRTDGGTFKFGSMDVAVVSTAAGGGIGYSVYGTLNGAYAASGGGGGAASTTYNYASWSSIDTSAVLDTVQITLQASTTDDNHVYVAIDNVTLTNVSPVPEPATMAVLAVGIAGLAAARRRA